MICYTYYTISPYFVKLYIVKRGFFPAVVAFHGTLFKLFKALFVVIIKGKAAIDGAVHVARVVGFEGKAVALSVAAVADGVAKTSCFSDYGHRTVTQRDHLRKAAGLAF